MTSWRPGLEGVVAAQTAVSRVDGAEGRLWMRGRPVVTLASMGFEAAAEIVLDASLDGLGEARVRAWEAQQAVRNVGTPLESTRARIAAGAWTDPVDGVASVAMALVFAHRSEVPQPDPAVDHATDLLRLLRGREGSEQEAAALGGYLTTVMDHGLNASTFAARLVTSTGSDPVSAVSAAFGALKGPLHGGAPGPVLDMLDAVGEPADAERWVGAELEAGRRIMGMGHRVYRVRDPRADVLMDLAEPLSSERFAVARAVEQAAQRALAARYPNRSLATNVEFATAVLLEALGLERGLFTGLFAAGRVVGWLAHIDEERRVGRIMRPRASYVGLPCR